MGQLALGFRSLLVKLSIFFVCAALLVWALGGQLWSAKMNADESASTFAGDLWFWRAVIGGDFPGELRWYFMHAADDIVQPAHPSPWIDRAGPVSTKSGLYFAGRQVDKDSWLMVHIDTDLELATWRLPDRISVEQQLDRVSHGLAIEGELLDTESGETSTPDDAR